MFIDGEVDFIIVSPSYGLLVVECKGGGISVKDNKYYQQIEWYQMFN